MVSNSRTVVVVVVVAAAWQVINGFPLERDHAKMDVVVVVVVTKRDE